MDEKVVMTDMFSDHGCNILVNPVNCVGTMGKGLSKDFAEHYPIYALDYKERCKHGYIKPGIVSIYYAGYGNYIVNFPTKSHWRNDSRYAYISTGLQSLHKELQFLDSYSIKIAMPRIGCGLGGLSWELVKTMIENHLVGNGWNVLYMEP